MSVRTLIAEDHALLRESLCAVLAMQDDIDVVAAVGTGTEALAAIREQRPDVAMLDIDMPGMSGLEVAEAVHADGVGCGLIMVTGYGKPGYLHRAIQAGALGFVTKNLSPTALVDAVHRVNGGGRYLDADIAADALALGQNPLTERELAVLRLSGSGRRPGEIATELRLAEGTVRNYLSSALQKLQADNRTAAYRLAEEAGWL